MILHRSEKEIIRVLFRESRPLPISEVAGCSGMSWITAKKYLSRLQKRSIIRQKSGKFYIDGELLKALHRRKDESNK